MPETLRATPEEMRAYLISIGAKPAVFAANGLEPPEGKKAAPRPPGYRELMALSEADFQRQITDYAELHGWRWWHVNDSRAQAMTDFPDLVLVRDRVLYREIKRYGGKVSPGQQVALEQLRRAGADAEVWWPNDWSLIEQTLA